MKPAFVLLIVIARSIMSAQDPVFTTSQNSLIHLNPSFTGSNEALRVNALYRAQWWQLDGSYLNYYLSGDAYLQKAKGGLGFSFLRDDQAHGTLITNELNLSYAQYLSFGSEKKFKIIPSVQMGYFIKTLDLSRVDFHGSYPPGTTTPWGSEENKLTKDNLRINSGLLFNSPGFYIGFSTFNINQPDEGLFGVNKRPLRYSAHASYNYIFSESTLLQIFANYQKQQSFEYYQLNLSLLLYKHLLTGAGFKTGNSPFVMLGYRDQKFCLIFNYERYFSALSASSVGAFELSLRFSFKKAAENLLNAIEGW
jgi:type IX secretion system PorP/SprF family membrane protein